MPTKPTAVKEAPHESNIVMMNTLREYARLAAMNDYTDRIPEATRNNIDNIYQSILDYKPRMQAFLDVIGRIGMTIFANNAFFNDLRGLKRGKLELGETVQEIVVNLVKGFQFNPELAQTDLYNYRIPDIRELFHELNYTITYKTSTWTNDVENAFISNYGVSQLIANVVDSLVISGEFDEYLTMKAVIDDFNSKGLSYPVKIDPITDQDSARNALVQIRAWAKKLVWPSTKYNPLGYSGLYAMTRPKNLILFVTPEVDALLDVQGLATLFNVEFGNIDYSKIVVDSFADENVQFMIADRDAFMFFDKYYEMETIWNPQGRYFNHILNIGEIMSYSLFKNVITFTTTETTVTAVTVSPSAVTVNKGDTRTFTAQATGTGIIAQNFKWSVSGGADAGTTINDAGILTVSPNETAATITVTATSLVDDTKSGTSTVTVAGNTVIES